MSGERLGLFKQILLRFPPGTYLDLGTGHGKFACLAHELGWTVTAVDARSDRLPNVSGITWIQADIRDFKIFQFDCIGILGLLYHLTIPDQQKLLRQCAGTQTIIDTHLALENQNEESGYEGQFFEEQLTAHTAAWGNQYSFWHTEESLYKILHDCGYTTVSKVLPQYRSDRAFFVAS